MITAVDTNVLLDLFDGSSEVLRNEAASALTLSSTLGSLTISTICYAELAPGFVSRRLLDFFLVDLRIGLSDISLEAAFIAGKMFVEHKRNVGRRGRIVPDFLIGAQAMLSANRLLTRDARFYGTAFKKLQVVSPRELLAR